MYVPKYRLGDLSAMMTFISVVIALGITGVISAKIGGAKPIQTTVRVILGGALAMAVTFGI